MKKNIPIVDLFAGPGGLGEGFSSLNEGKSFKILISAEMDSSACETLKLRAYYRQLKRNLNRELPQYYKYCEGKETYPYNHKTKKIWKAACDEAQKLTLGDKLDNEKLNAILTKNKINFKKDWVLIGGPPCQAYSIIGRSRNLGKESYKPEKDSRHFLYKEYLNVIKNYQPKIFVMENVKGILSSKINGKNIFHTILSDLSNPSANSKKSYRYKIYSLTSPTYFETGMDVNNINLKDFIVKSEDFGIPQARHRVILLGVRSDVQKKPRVLIKSLKKITVSDAISDLPFLKSKITKQKENSSNWVDTYKDNLASLIKEGAKYKCYSELVHNMKNFQSGIQKSNVTSKNTSHELHKWFRDNRLKVVLNHEPRGHIKEDLKRYLYAAFFALTYLRSPNGHEEFKLKGLKPNHKNWESGKFSDRFRVQLNSKPATTITSHISKDGHNFIHPDPAQNRSLTVREAARLQTFPDNYFFQGTRTQQFHQVGNAVPPLLAKQIAEIIQEII